MRVLLDLLFALSHPSYWLMNKPYDKTWDKTLRSLLESGHKFTPRGRYHADIGGVRVWIENHPYASFIPTNPELEIRPSRRTIKAAREKLVRDVLVNACPPFAEEM